VLLVVLPGMDGSGELLSEFVAEFGDDIPRIVVRYPPDRPLGYPELETFVRTLLPKNEPYVLLAESFSGPIAISIASSQPSELAGVILSASFACNPRPFLSILRPLLGVLPLKHVPVALLSAVLLGRFATPQHRTALSNALAALSLPTLRARARAVLDVDVTPHLRANHVPLLYLGATDDRLVPPGCEEAIVRAVPQARAVEIEAPHFLLQAAPAPAAAAIRKFIAALPASARS
jgi:pimeloyl-ACP methyl ester carboxylesterase